MVGCDDGKIARRVAEELAMRAAGAGATQK